MKDIYLEEKFQQYKKVRVGTKFTQVYGDSAIAALSISSATALKLLFWILPRMDEHNFVTIRKSEKMDFILDCKKANGKRYSMSTMNRVVKELVDCGILISNNLDKERLGRYIVNPIYFWKSNNQKLRTERISEVYQFLKFKKNETN